ncbi:MAG: hypothetical protein KGJ59_01075 [Bacteroidota bacterium]|nr:hypothetical protein [Bacteroidota bacterium]
MNRSLAFGYLTAGFLIGLTVSVVGTGTDLTVVFKRIGFFFGVIVLIGLWQWFESHSHKRHLAQWEKYADQGKWNFIVTRYVLARGVIVVLFIFLPFAGRLPVTTDSLGVLLLTVLIAFSVLAFLGYQEWKNCRQDFEIRSLKEAAQSAKQ